MVGLHWYIRLLKTTFWQRTLHFKPPERSFRSLNEPDKDSSGQSLPPCVALVTGGNNGIGFETAYYLASCGATVIISSRSKSRGDEAIARMRQRAGRGLDLHCFALDLSDLASVNEFAGKVKNFLGTHQLQLLVNNAGIMDVPYQTSKQGHELTFATNHLGHFLLTKLLVPAMKKPGGRVVVVSGEIFTLADGASPDYKYGSAQDAYARSKLANIWHAYELQRREPQLVVPVLHPGVINTTLGSYGRVVQLLKRLLFITREQGAWTTLYCCLADVRGNTYYHNSLGIVPTTPVSHDQHKARALWDLSEQLVKDFT